MDNPFGKIDEQRKLVRRKQDQHRHARHEAQLSYTGMVEEVLQQLRLAEYPECKVQEYGGGWSINEEYEEEFADARMMQLCSRQLVVVRLAFDPDDEPVHFECSVRNKTSKTHALSREDLIDVLILLHTQDFKE